MFIHIDIDPNQDDAYFNSESVRKDLLNTRAKLYSPMMALDVSYYQKHEITLKDYEKKHDAFKLQLRYIDFMAKALEDHESYAEMRNIFTQMLGCNI